LAKRRFSQKIAEKPLKRENYIIFRVENRQNLYQFLYQIYINYII